MCTPLVPLAGAINTVDQTRRRVLGWQGKGEYADDNKSSQVTNNYYGRNAEEAEGEASSNKNALKLGNNK